MNAESGAGSRPASRFAAPDSQPCVAGIGRNEHALEQSRLTDDGVDRRVIEEAAAEAQPLGRHGALDVAESVHEQPGDLLLQRRGDASAADTSPFLGATIRSAMGSRQPRHRLEAMAVGL